MKMASPHKRNFLCSATYPIAAAPHLVEKPRVQFDAATWKYIREHPELKLVPAPNGFRMVPR